MGNDIPGSPVLLNPQFQTLQRNGHLHGGSGALVGWNARRDARSMRASAAEGFAALKRGDPRAARDLLTRLVQAGEADAAVWFAVAAAHRQLDSAAEESYALDQVLKLDPNRPRSDRQGDLFARLGDQRAASAHYGVAIRLANSLPSQPKEWRAELDRIAAVRHHGRQFRGALHERAGSAGFGEAGTERVAHAVDLLLGKRQIFLQQPSNFYFPRASAD